jgi:putative membrane protein
MSKTTEKPIAMDTSTRLAYDRTRLAYENTMMAWVRTATSLITFGFSVYKFFEFDIKRGQEFSGMIGPREFGLMMITFGLISLLAGTLQHVMSLRQLRAEYPTTPRSVAALLAGLVSILGLVALVAVLFRK